MAFFMKVNICIIGCGGTGGNLIARLARFLSGDTGDLTINVAVADGDTVEYKNMDRQPFDGEDLGENKAVVLAENIESCLHVRQQTLTGSLSPSTGKGTTFQAVPTTSTSW